jgi:hypothetical protein
MIPKLTRLTTVVRGLVYDRRVLPRRGLVRDRHASSHRRGLVPDRHASHRRGLVYDRYVPFVFCRSTISSPTVFKLIAPPYIHIIPSFF